ncbi:MAG TPA: hypothetical protein VGE31_01320 [Candidatus Paceibacterota bacterium]
MDQIGRIIITPRRPEYPYTIELPVPPKRVLWRERERPDLILIIYDTQRIQYLNEEVHQCARYGTRPLYVPAKYAVTYEDSWTDSGIFCQHLASHDDALEHAIWFNAWHDLPLAIAKLKEKFPELTLPDQIDYVLDWPHRADKERLEPGHSFVTPEPPVVPPRDDDD